MPAYAAGLLRGRSEDAVRRHLAGGCRECLSALFRLPVGLPREPSDPRVPAAAWPLFAAVLAIIALTGTVLVSTIWLGGRARPVTRHALRRPARVEALEARASAARAGLTALGRRSRQLAGRLDALEEAGGESVAREHGGEAPSGSARSSEHGRAPTEAVLARLGSALALPATRLAPLRAPGAGGGVRGWLVWDPLRGRLFVYAFGLPKLPAPWRAQVTAGDDAHSLPLRRLVDGGLWAILEPAADRMCGAHVTVTPPAADRTVLAGDVDACPVGPAA